MVSGLIFKTSLIVGFSNLLLIKHSDCINELQGYVKNYLPKEGDVVIDAGSFYGIFAIYAAKLVGKKEK